MSNKANEELSQNEHDELCCSYAAMILYDDGLEITPEKLAKLIKDSGNTVEPHWTKMFADSLKPMDIGQ